MNRDPEPLQPGLCLIPSPTKEKSRTSSGLSHWAHSPARWAGGWSKSQSAWHSLRAAACFCPASQGTPVDHAPIAPRPTSRGTSLVFVLGAAWAPRRIAAHTAAPTAAIIAQTPFSDHFTAADNVTLTKPGGTTREVLRRETPNPTRAFPRERFALHRADQQNRPTLRFREIGRRIPARCTDPGGRAPGRKDPVCSYMSR